MDKELSAHAEIPGAEFADKVDDQKQHLPHKEEVVVEQIQCHKKGKQPVAVVVQHFVQRPQQVRKQCHHIHKVVEKDVVHRKAGQCIQAGAQHGIVPVADVPLEVEVRTAARRCKLEHQQRHHQVRQPALRKNEREPEERRTVQVERIGIHDPAAQVGGP